MLAFLKEIVVYLFWNGGTKGRGYEAIRLLRSARNDIMGIALIYSVKYSYSKLEEPAD